MFKYIIFPQSDERVYAPTFLGFTAVGATAQTASKGRTLTYSSSDITLAGYPTSTHVGLTSRTPSPYVTGSLNANWFELR